MSSSPQATCTEDAAPDHIRHVNEQLAQLREQIAALGVGKESKRDRQKLNQAIYKLELGDEYVAAVKERDAATKSEAAAATLVAEAAAAAARALEDAAAAAAIALLRHPAPARDKLELEQHYRQQVEALFDEYADHFEQALCEGLRYRTPDHLYAMLLERSGRTPTDIAEGILSRMDAVDFGCGTGLMGVQLRVACCGRLIGCDLSRGMLKVAATRHKGVYDELVASDAISFLRKLSPGSADLIVGCDVCVYLRSLEPMFAAAEAALCEGGVLAFSTESCTLEEASGGLPPNGDGFVERQSERIAHSPEYLHWLVASRGGTMEMVSLAEVDLRMDGARMIRGNIAIMAKRRAG
jgi:predicted TPR repeat methyltransferase